MCPDLLSFTAENCWEKKLEAQPVDAPLKMRDFCVKMEILVLLQSDTVSLTLTDCQVCF